LGLLLALLCGPGPQQAHAAFGDRITVSGTQFMAATNRLWINGVNTPWHRWNDFGGQFDPDWWDQHLQQLHQSGINATRVWISCNGEMGSGELASLAVDYRAQPAVERGVHL